MELQYTLGLSESQGSGGLPAKAVDHLQQVRDLEGLEQLALTDTFEGLRGVSLGRRGHDQDGDVLEPRVGLDAVIELDAVQDGLYRQAAAFVAANTHPADDEASFVAALAQGGFVRVLWAGSSEDEAKIQEAHGATIRCLPFEQPAAPGTCFYTGKETSTVALFARAY